MDNVRLGPPDLKISGLQIWIHDRDIPDAEDYWDGNWLLYYKAGRNRDAIAEWGRALLCPHPFDRDMLTEELKQVESLLAEERR